MKYIKKILFILILFLSCFIIYNVTIDDEVYYVSLGNSLSLEEENYTTYVKDYLIKNDLLEEYNDNFIDNNYRITDLYSMIKNNTVVDNITMNQVLKKADIITLSIGMNELYYNMLVSNNSVYDNVNEMIKDMEKLFYEIDRYSHDKVFVLGSYNITDNNQDVVNYYNYKLQKLVKKYDFIYLDLEKIVDKNEFVDNNFNLKYDQYIEISKIIVEKIKK